jgi:hypothetical protein
MKIMSRKRSKSRSRIKIRIRIKIRKEGSCLRIFNVPFVSRMGCCGGADWGVLHVPLG